MATSCSFHGIVGIQNAAPYALEKKRFWKMDGFVPLPVENEDVSADLPVSVFTFGGRTAPPDDGVYFINARLITAVANDETSLELYCVDDIQPLDGGRALPSVLIAGKVSRGTSDLAENRMFDIDVMQYGMMPQQLARMRCYYPPAHPRLDRTPVPGAEKHVIIQGAVTEVTHKRCVICVHDITLGPSTSVVDSRHHRDAAPPGQLKSFNWAGKGKKSKRAAHSDSEAESDTTHRKKGKKREIVPDPDVGNQPGPSATKKD